MVTNIIVLMIIMSLNIEEDIPLGSMKEEVTTEAKQQGLNFNLADPLGTCKMDFGGFRLCDNISNSKGTMRWVLIGVAIVAVIIGDVGDILAWAVGWIPVIGDILGNTVFGNIVDAVVLIVLFWLIGFPAFFGIGEFIDILGFIPIIGDVAGMIEWLPAWMFAIAIYGIYKLIKSSGNGQISVQNLLGSIGIGSK